LLCGIPHSKRVYAKPFNHTIYGLANDEGIQDRPYFRFADIMASTAFHLGFWIAPLGRNGFYPWRMIFDPSRALFCGMIARALAINVLAYRVEYCFWGNSRTRRGRCPAVASPGGQAKHYPRTE